jgi:hypothetical protein
MSKYFEEYIVKYRKNNEKYFFINLIEKYFNDSTFVWY